jgi:hypothetical protein
MIRVRKNKETPKSLLAGNCNRYDGDDVKEALYSDQVGKCYLCEQTTGKDFEIEHLKAKAEGFYPELKFTWSNLFLACPYCNGRKPNEFTDLFDPSENNVEEIIEQRILFPKNKIELKSNQDSPSALQTINLLDRLLNGKSGVRDIKGNILYKDMERELIFFMGLLTKYKEEQNNTNKQAIIDCLDISKEFLGFKYWIIKDNDSLYSEFSSFVVWNKRSE